MPPFSHVDRSWLGLHARHCGLTDYVTFEGDSTVDAPKNDEIPGASGTFHPSFTNAVQAFAGLFPSPRLGGGALSVYLDGEAVVDVWTGWADRKGEQPWTANTGALAFSSTKGLTSTIIHRLVDRGALAYDEPVASYWPEFGVNGKASITLRDLMAHRGGLSRLGKLAASDLLDARRMEARLAAAPVDRRAGRSAYHALTYGWLMSGAARAVTGSGMRELFRTELAQPLDSDGIHLGRPPVGAPIDVAETLLPHSTTVNSIIDFIVPKIATRTYSGMLGAVYVPGVLDTLQGDMTFLDAEIPSANAVLTARGLAKVYAAIANGGRIDGARFLSRELVHSLTGRRSYALDANVGVPMSFHLGYHNSPVPRLLPGFGHSGLGGSIGWADPGAGSSFGFVHNRLATRKVFDQASFARLAVLLRRAIVDARRDEPNPEDAPGEQTGAALVR
jgi:CubicO group peptidase (beta-lactamase class C family)